MPGADRSVLVRLRMTTADFDRAADRVAVKAALMAKNLESTDSRMANLVQTSLALGPALVPISAAAVPAVAGLTTQLGFAVAGAGTMVLAFQGVGDALKALNEARLNPTAENLQKMHEAMSVLGPDGRDFVRTLQALRPEMQKLQDAAQTAFPGFTEGLDEAMETLPQAERLIGTIATTMGDLAAQAGDRLNDDQWVEFFEFLDREAATSLTTLTKSLGNAIEGVTNMVMAFDPLSDMFAGGLLDATRDFREWSDDLASSQGFQNFVDYIQDNGPQAMETLGAIANALVSLVQAAAPVGAVALPVLEAIADTLSAVADSPAGPVLISAAAGLAAISRAVAVFNAANGSALLSMFRQGKTDAKDFDAAIKQSGSGLAVFNEKVAGLKRGAAIGGAAVGTLALSMTDLDEQAGLSNTAMFALMGTIAGPWGAAIGGAVGLTMDLAAANDDLEAAVERVQDAFAGSDTGEQEAALRDLEQQVQATKDGYTDLLNAIGERDVFGFAEGLVGGAKSAFLDLTGATGEAEEALDEYRAAASKGQGLGDIMAGGLGVAEDAFRAATQSAEEFYDSLNKVNALLDKRAAFRAARDAVRDFNATLEDAPKKLKPETAAWDAAEGALDKIADSSLVAAGHLRGMARVNFIDKMRDQFIEAAQAMGFPIERAEALATRLGLLDKQRPKPKVDVDTGAANQKLTATERELMRLTGTTAKPKVALQDAASGALRAIRGLLAGLDGDSATTYVRTVYTTTGGGGYTGKQLPGIPSAWGNVFFAGGDVVNGHQPMLARGGPMRMWNEPETGGEAYIPLRNDGRRGRAKSIAETVVEMFGGDVEWYARGGGRRPFDNEGRPGRGPRTFQNEGRPVMIDGEFVKPIKEAGKGLKGLKERLRDATKELEREIEQRRRLRDRIDSFKSEVRSSFDHDPFGNGLEGFDLQLRADRNDARAMKAALARAKGKGLSGSLFQALAASGDLTTAQQFAGLSRSGIAERERLFAATSTAQAGLANFAAKPMEKAFDKMTREIERDRKERRELAQAVKKLGKNVEDGARKGIADRDKSTAQRSRARR